MYLLDPRVVWVFSQGLGFKNNFNFRFFSDCSICSVVDSYISLTGLVGEMKNLENKKIVFTLVGIALFQFMGINTALGAHAICKTVLVKIADLVDRATDYTEKVHTIESKQVKAALRTSSIT